ncbi:mediator of RNA polymerase II transcription subunit 7 [Plasmodium gonderi]|uniref:Mediator of RNA polymerase II transcription subunit 7 n=1 Tax=Plasmodium gonderi TaxID=77519 RepID=A0A1Y1JHW7_PLAGO|nr:mediator of RNA polymerase II transcription subunit 7 [Plasmodium gonderi]GAW79684.1 mediator of RNA polymerase II transcription subunit 7 [Plasmodium gonderi]
MGDKYVSGYPAPPYYYDEYVDADEEVEGILKRFQTKENEVEENYRREDVDGMNFLKRISRTYDIYDISENMHVDVQKKSNVECMRYIPKKCQVILGRPPPLPLKSNYNIFGLIYEIERRVEDLESDELLYDIKKNLKNEFIRLYKMYKDSFFDLFDDIVNNRKDDKTKVKTLIKVHINLFHILANLRYFQAVNNIINVLKVQLKRRQIAIDKMKLSLLHVYDYINFVQDNLSTSRCIPNDVLSRGIYKRRKRGGGEGEGIEKNKNVEYLT